MGRKIKITESQLDRLLKRIINEDENSGGDLKFYNETYKKDCIIRVARKKDSATPNSYRAVVLCDVFDDGELYVVGELSVYGKSEEEVNEFICDNLEEVKKEFDELFGVIEEPLMESVKSSRWDVSDNPITCEIEDNSEFF